MGIKDFIPFYSSLDNPDLYMNVYDKYEFNEESRTNLLKYQQFISRFLSSHTPYDEVLLFYGLGTGKTCASVAVIEQIRYENNGFRGALFLARSESLLNNFVNEMLFVCTQRKYIPEDYNDLTRLQKTIVNNKILKSFYKLDTYEVFAKYVANSTDSRLQSDFNNFVIVIDEIHNIREHDKDSQNKIKLYKQFHRFLHTVKGCKIMLMSGTPIKDSDSEIIDVMNLILPLDKQLRDMNDESLRSAMRGRVSYIKSLESTVPLIFMGSTLGNLKHLVVFEDRMSPFQSAIYTSAYNMDRNKEKKGIYNNSRQAILAVYPDGSYGEAGFKKYIDNFKLNTEARKEFGPEGNLSKYSSKYADSVRNALRAYKEGKCMFIYNEFVQGSGIILFMSILKLYGYSDAINSDTKTKAMRFAVITNQTATPRQVNSIIERFNSPDNLHGEYIHLIIGSQKIIEGFSLRNIQVEEIHTPWFNYSETTQAIGRGYRYGSHALLPNATVEVYQRVSIPVDDTPSIDLEMYQMSEDKDVKIKRVERIAKESAIDCAIFYDRNRVYGKDGQRECEYTSCDYNCTGITGERKNDYSTYQLFYNKADLDLISEKIKYLFHHRFVLKLVQIRKMLNDLNSDKSLVLTEFNIISALLKIINNNEHIINKYGFVSYLRENSNRYFLVNTLTTSNLISSYYYTKIPHIHSSISFESDIESLAVKRISSLLSSLTEKTAQREFETIIQELPENIQEMLVESAILADTQNVNTNVKRMILDYFSGYYTNIDGVWVSWFLPTTRCLTENGWSECTDEYNELVSQHNLDRIKELESNEYGVYGQLNKFRNEFCIRDISGGDIEGKKHKIKSGKRCKNWKKPDLMNLVVNVLRIKHESIPDNIRELDDEELKKVLSKSKIEIKPEYSREDKLSIAYWSTFNNVELCDVIQRWMMSNNLIVEDKQCGQVGKVKN